MSGPSWQRMNRTRMEWNGCNTETGTRDGQCPSPDLLHLSNGKSRKEAAGSQGASGFSGLSEEVASRPAGKAYRKPDPTPAKTNKRLAARFCQLKLGHCLTSSTSSGRRTSPQPSAGGARTGARPGNTFSRTAPTGRPSKKSNRWKYRKRIGSGSEISPKMSWRSQAILYFLSTTDVGRRVGLDMAVEEARSEASVSEQEEGRGEEENRGMSGEE